MDLLKKPRFPSLAALILCAGWATAAATQPEVIGEVTVLEGRADVTREGQAAQLLAVGDEIYRSDILRTKSDSRLEVQLADGSVITLDGNTRVEVAEYLPAEGTGLLDMARGRLRATVSKTFSERKDGFKLKTNTSVMGVQGTDFAVIARSLETTVYVFAGIVSVTSLDPDFAQPRILRAGQFTRVRLGEPVEAPAGFEPPAGDDRIMGSGSDQDIQSGGLQSNDPTVVAPQPPPVEVPPEPNPPGG